MSGTYERWRRSALRTKQSVHDEKLARARQEELALLRRLAIAVARGRTPYSLAEEALRATARVRELEHDDTV